MSANVWRKNWNDNKQGAFPSFPCMDLQPSLIPPELCFDQTYFVVSTRLISADLPRLAIKATPHIASGFDTEGALMLQSYLLRSEPVFVLFDGTPSQPDWHRLDAAQTRREPRSTHTCSASHYKDCTHTHKHSFIPGYVSSLGCQSNIHNNLLLDFQQHLSLPACLFPFLLSKYSEKSQYEFCQYRAATSLSFCLSLLLW